jgi:tRNA pseudouridine55 synthase
MSTDDRMVHPIPVYGIGQVLPQDMNGTVLLMDKPPGWSSFRVISVLRKLCGIRKIGHAGTLDPMATGLLVCCVGRTATRQVDTFMNLEKVYTGSLRLGQVTPSYDAETEVVETHPWAHVSDETLAACRKDFIGTIQQRPPMYSAIKIGGERLYKKARRGEHVDRPLRTVHLYTFELMGREGPDVHFEVRCSKGTYIRSLAHDFGQALGVGAHLSALRRTAIGPHRVDTAWTVEALSAALRSR